MTKTKAKKKEPAPMSGPLPRIITLTQAAKEWNLPKTAIRKLVHQGKLDPFTNFKEWRFYENDIHQPGVLERL